MYKKIKPGEMDLHEGDDVIDSTKISKRGCIEKDHLL